MISNIIYIFELGIENLISQRRLVLNMKERLLDESALHLHFYLKMVDYCLISFTDVTCDVQGVPIRMALDYISGTVYNTASGKNNL